MAARTMFHWRARGVRLLASRAQTSELSFVRVDVRVEEETSPVYTLVVTVVPATDAAAAMLERRVTKHHLARLFEQAIAQPSGHVAVMRTRYLDQDPKQTHVYDDAVDSAVRGWVCGETSRPPTREQLVKWLLSRMVLTKGTNGWTLVVCGEEQGAVRRPAEEDDGDASKQRDANGGGRPDLAKAEAVRPMSPPPPPYSAGSDRSERALSDSSDYPAFFDDVPGGDEDQAPDSDGDDVHDATRKYTEQIRGESTSQPHLQATSPKREVLSHSRSAGKLSTRDLVDDRDEHSSELPVPSQYRFEPARERITSQRRHSLSSSITTNAWTEERHHFQLELTQSKRDIEIAQERQRKAEAIASLRRKLTVEQSQKKLLAHEQKLRDARFVKQSISDTLEYHDIAHRLESQLKQTKIAATRDQEKLSQSMRIALGRSGNQWRKGPVIGKGPLSQIEIDLLTRGNRKACDSPSMWVYDLHGRRHHERDAGALAAENVFDSAMKKVQRLLDRRPAESVDLFRQYDFDHSGTLEYGEFKHLLQENGVELSNEQSKTLFRHFDPNRSGAIDYGELLWGFFTRRAFLKRWKQRKTKLSAREIKQMFYKYDRVGRGALSPVDFQLALDDIGFRVSESEAKLLCLKFDTNKDGFIDYNEFHAFVNDDLDDGNDDNRASSTATSKERRRSISPEKAMLRRRSAHIESGLTSSSGASDVERILAELRALSETQEKIHKSLATTH